MEDGFVQRFLEIRIGGRYQLCERLGAGTFGYVYLGTHVAVTKERELKRPRT
jgi:serine/threonine protein kinase